METFIKLLIATVVFGELNGINLPFTYRDAKSVDIYSDNEFQDDKFCIVPINDKLQKVPVGYIWTNPSQNDPCSICRCTNDHSYNCRPLRCLDQDCPLENGNVIYGQCCHSCVLNGQSNSTKSCNIGINGNTQGQIFDHLAFIKFEYCGEQCICVDGTVICYNEFCWSQWINRLIVLIGFFLLMFGTTVAVGRLIIFIFRREEHDHDCQCEHCAYSGCGCNECAFNNCNFGNICQCETCLAAHGHCPSYENLPNDPYYSSPNAETYAQKKGPADFHVESTHQNYSAENHQKEEDET
ncbi:hypothetical protein ACOME3_001705 [Neoechinorhynchus agilis]